MKFGQNTCSINAKTPACAGVFAQTMQKSTADLEAFAWSKATTTARGATAPTEVTN